MYNLRLLIFLLFAANSRPHVFNFSINSCSATQSHATGALEIVFCSLPFLWYILPPLTVRQLVYWCVELCDCSKNSTHLL
jgi:hypothetical protein